MDKQSIKPYELSIWDSTFTNVEHKIAVIGSNILKAPNMAYNIVFTKDKNGEKTLRFCLKYKYLNPTTGEFEENPFVPYLINERKVKLYYEDIWYDFIIKEIEENSEEYEWSYTAYDAFVLELSKNGYDITFSNDLNNNIGTAQQLAERTLEGTDWEPIDIDVGEPKINEPVYKGKLQRDIFVKDMDTDLTVKISPVAGQEYDVLIFYSYIANKNGKFLQFIKAEDDETKYNVDSTNHIIATNYRFDEDVEIDDTNDANKVIKNKNGEILIQYNDIYTSYEVYRIIYQQLTTYDPIMEKVVDEFQGGGLKVYHYTDSIYTTSNVVTSFVANGDHFNTYEDGSSQGWDRFVYKQVPNGSTITDNDLTKVELTTYPNIDPSKALIEASKLKQLDGYLQVKFNNRYSNSYIFNSGVQYNHSLIQQISKGDKFVFRWCVGTANTEHGRPQRTNSKTIRAKVAFYETVDVEINRVTRPLKKITSTILDFNSGSIQTKNNIIENGKLVNGKYIVNGVEEVPSTKYLYRHTGNDNNYNKLYYWNVDSSTYVEYNSTGASNFLDYYCLIATASQTVTKEQLEDPNIKIGLFIYTTNDSPYYYFRDIQLTRYYTDEANEIVTIGNVPQAKVQETNYYYVAPKSQEEKNKTILYLDLNTLEDDYGISPHGTIKPVYNQGLTYFLTNHADLVRVLREQNKRIYDLFTIKGYSLNKVSSIEAFHSNCFNILQTIAENFECWIDIDVVHNTDGSIFLDDEGKPIKTILLRQFCGKDNFAGFKYGINLNSINRTLDSNEIVTKLIVEPMQSDLVDKGMVSIAGAESNFNRESYIYNFNYFINQGLLDKTQFEEALQEFNSTINQLNVSLDKLEQKKIQLLDALTKIKSNRNIFGELLENAEKEYNKAIDDFEVLTKQKYSEYQGTTITDPPNSSLVNIDKIRDTIGRIYNNSAIQNSYRGLYTNTNSDYLDKYRELYGIKKHTVRVLRVDSNVRIELDDFVVPFSFICGGQSYSTSLSKKTFDIEITNNNYNITNISYDTDSKTGYHLVNKNGGSVTSITPSLNTVQIFTLVPNISAQENKSIETQINEILELKKEYIKNFNSKYSRFILEGTWSSNEYLSDELYYLDALAVSHTSAFPKVTYTINVTDVSGIEGYDAYSFNAGDKTFVEDTEFFGWTYKAGIKTPAREEIIVSSIERHLDDPSQSTITVQNYKDHFEDLFQRIQATVQTVQYNETVYPKTSSILDETKNLNQKLLLASLHKIAGQQRPLTTDGSIEVDGDAIIITNQLKKANKVKLSSEGISFTSNGGTDWHLAVTGDGINIEEVISDFINTKKIWIGNRENPSYRWDSNGLSAFKLLNDGKYDFKQFVRFDQWGLYGIDLKSELNHRQDYDYIATSLDDVKRDANFAVTWDGFFIKNSYPGGGRVSLTSENDFQIIKLYQSQEREVIKIGALEWGEDAQYHPILSPTAPGATTEPTLYGIRITNNEGIETFKTGTSGDIEITGTINALGGNFTSKVTVGKLEGENPPPYIILDGSTADASSEAYNTKAIIRTSNYKDGAASGWMINSDGDAVFNNITARGAIKTAVFEYAEIEAVGGLFIFRPSSTIKNAESSGNDLIIEVEKPFLFAKIKYDEVINPSGDPKSQGWYEYINYKYKETTDTTVDNSKTYYSQTIIPHSWAKISNYTNDGVEPDIRDVSVTNGLTHVYKISNVDLKRKKITLEGAAASGAFIDSVKQTGETDADVLASLEGGALIDMGRETTDEHYDKGIHNYGIGINSSDNTVNLPARAISLFETEIHSNPQDNIKVTYDYRGILGTLPILSANKVDDDLYNRYIAGTQGIYTDNMYIGNDSQYITFYKDDQENKHLKIKAKEFNLTADEDSLTDSGFMYLANIDYNGTPIDINGNYSNWRQIIGNKFGVTSSGDLYASNVDITGAITATSLKISGDNTDYSAQIPTISSKASNGAEYSVTITASSWTTTTCTLTAVIYKLGVIQTTSTQLTGISYKWYKNNTLISGQTTATLAVTDLDAVYTCVISK